MFFPSIDGHFWVERDGKIIDPYFKEYEMIKKINKLGNEQVHLEAEETIQKIMIEMFKRKTKSALGGEDWDEVMKNCINLLKSFNRDKICFNRCWFNCILEISKNGGEIKFGSMGWKHKNSDNVFYEYGGVDYKIKDFIN